MPSPIRARPKRLPTVVAFGATLIVGAAGYWVSRSQLHATMQRRFDVGARTSVAAVEGAVAERLVILQALHSLYSYTGGPGPEVRAFVEPIIRQWPGIQGIEWVVRVPASERSAFEAARRAEGISHFEITERGRQGALVRAADGDEYFPIFPVPPMDPGDPIGFDLSSEPQRRAALEEARDSARMSASSRLTLMRESGLAYGFIVFLPFYETPSPPPAVHERRRLLTGFLIGVFDIGDIVVQALTLLEADGFEVTLRDESAPADENFLATFNAIGARPPPEDRARFGAVRLTAYKESISVAGRVWSVVVSPSSDTLRAGNAGAPLFLLMGILATGGLLTAYLQQTARLSHDLTVAAAKLDQSVREKQILLDEIHHRVRNNLQVISSLHSLHSRAAGHEDVRRAFDEMRGRIDTMALIHEQLYGSSDLSRIAISEFARALANRLVLTHARPGVDLTAEVTAEEIELTVEKAVPVGLILHELVSNALVHGYLSDGSGRIDVRIGHSDDDRVRLVVEDDGIGMPPEVDMAAPRSLGLQIVGRLVEQLGGTLEVHRGEGTMVIVEFAS